MQMKWVEVHFTLLVEQVRIQFNDLFNFNFLNWKSLLYSQSLRLDKFLDEHNVDDTFGSDIKQVPDGMPRLTTSISKSSSFRKLSDTISGCQKCVNLIVK